MSLLMAVSVLVLAVWSFCGWHMPSALAFASTCLTGCRSRPVNSVCTLESDLRNLGVVFRVKPKRRVVFLRKSGSHLSSTPQSNADDVSPTNLGNDRKIDTNLQKANFIQTAANLREGVHPQQGDHDEEKRKKLEGKLMKQLRRTALDYEMIQPNDHIMCCVSGGKDSATLLHLLLRLQSKLSRPAKCNSRNESSATTSSAYFRITAVHLDQVQPGYDGSTLQAWLERLGVPHLMVREDTYSIVKSKTPENKSYCSLCSRLRRGILYSVAKDIGATKLALGHHGDDAIETMLLNMVHNGQMKSMPARYYSHERDAHVIRPLIHCLEEDIASFAQMMKFPVLPCNLCGAQEGHESHRAKVKLLGHSLTMLNPMAKRNLLHSMSDVRPSHMLDKGLRIACGMDGVTGRVLQAGNAKHVTRGFVESPYDSDGGSSGCSSGFGSSKYDGSNGRDLDFEPLLP